MNLNNIKEHLVVEAKNSPNLLSDLAGLETYISESYSNRSFIELLQNADDANASYFIVQKINNYLLVANNGRTFTENDVESLCRSASSKKIRGNNIGYRGVGFKSVVSIAKEVHLISGDWEITFSKKLTQLLIPEASRVPLIRIPHKLKNDIKTDLNEHISRLKTNGFNTIFIFSNVPINQIENEYSNFPITSLLFLRHIQKIDIIFSSKIHNEIKREHPKSNFETVQITNNNKISNWITINGLQCNLSWKLDNGEISQLNKNEALIHAFLPTEDHTGFPFIINGDFSTDPSRRHLILDETTENIIQNAAKTYINFISQIIFDSENNYCRNISSISPLFDVQIINLGENNFQKRFCKYVVEAMTDNFKVLQRPPIWLNRRDFFILYSNSKDIDLNLELINQNNSDSILNLLGANKNCSISEILNYTDKTEISLLGYAQIAAQCFKLMLFNQINTNFITKNIFQSNGKISSLEYLNNNNLKIDNSFIQLMLEQGINQKDINWCLKKINMNVIELSTSNDYTNQNSTKNSEKNDINRILKKYSSNIANTVNIKRWRSAEENTLITLNSIGFKLKDVSKLNLGYDLEGTSPSGENIFIEVKSIDYIGQKFRITNNEYAVAQFRNKSYYIATIFQDNSHLEINLIQDPIKVLKLNHQCVQWIWECEEYQYNPINFNI